jgi:hypothetical protein
VCYQPRNGKSRLEAVSASLSSISLKYIMAYRAKELFKKTTIISVSKFMLSFYYQVLKSQS